MSSNSWLERLSALNVSRANAAHCGVAPHKPLMLLTVIDMIESGELPDREVPYDVRLVSRFRDWWQLVSERRGSAPDISLPFHALGSRRDRVWQTLTRDREPSPSKDTTRVCRLDPELRDLLDATAFRREARRRLASLYFPPGEQVMLFARLGLALPKTAEIDALRGDVAAFRARRKKGRDSRFQSDVLAGYRFTCALTGYRLDTEDRSIVQAAHIHRHAESGNNEPCNGLALTPDAHWLFDAGLWTAVPSGPEFLVHVAKGKFLERSWPGALVTQPLSACQGRPLRFHEDSILRPDPECLTWHRQKCFLG